MPSTEEIFRIQSRKQRQLWEDADRKYQSNCPHMAGCNPLSECQGLKTSIVWHTFFPNTPPTGICTNCTRKFVFADPDYAEWIRKESFNKSSAGRIPVYGNEEPASDEPESFSDWNSPIYINDFSPDPLDWSEEKFQRELAKKTRQYKALRAAAKAYHE